MKVGRFKIRVVRACSCCSRPEWQKWIVVAGEQQLGWVRYKPVYFENNYAAVLFAFYVARVTPAKVLQREP